MTRIGFVSLAMVLIAGGIGWLASARHAKETMIKQDAVAERPAAERDVLDAALESPEAMDRAATDAEPAVPVCPLPTGSGRHLLSDIEKPPTPQPLKEPVKIENLYFHADFASLRTEAVRNPDSPENRAGVVSLMKARQRRLGMANGEPGAGQ